jgi:hypothetical protein
VTAWDPWQGERVPVAWSFVLDELGDGEWHDWQPLAEDMASLAGILCTSAEGILYGAVRAGALQRRGRPRPRSKRARSRPDGRQVRLAPGGLLPEWKAPQ